ncbi:ribosome bioproteinsis protein ytm1 [Neopestalotiopsis sp. 37M]|nr:ribosome bioproteinsis protein ytm1 [Neopestalotiopsis sp. 37M]
MDAATEAQQIRVNFTTNLPELQLPEGKSQLLVPGDIKRYGLSRVLNSESMLNTDSPIPLDFLVNGTYLRTSLEDYLKENGLSFETTVTLQYVKSLMPPMYQASFEHDDWITDIDVLSATSRAGVWAGESLRQGQNRILSASYDGLLRIWNGSGQVVATSPSASNGGHSAAVKAAKFMSSTQLASAGMDRTVRVWKYSETDEFSGEIKPTLELFGHTASVESLDVHTPSKRILSASKDGSVGLWTTSKSSAPEAPASLLPGAGTNVSKKRKIAAAAPQRGALSMMPLHNNSAVSGALFHPDDATVAYSASEDHTIKTIDLTTASVVSTLTTAHPLLCLAALPGMSTPLLAAGTSARHITLVDPRASAATTSVMTLRGHRNFVTSIDASPNDNYSLVSGSHDGTCRIWDLRSVRSGTKAEGGGSVSEAVYVVERETQKGGKQQKKRADVPGAGVKVFAAVWDKHWGIVSGGEDKQVQINKGSDLLLPKA